MGGGGGGKWYLMVQHSFTYSDSGRRIGTSGVQINHTSPTIS